MKSGENAQILWEYLLIDPHSLARNATQKSFVPTEWCDEVVRSSERVSDDPSAELLTGMESAYGKICLALPSEFRPKIGTLGAQNVSISAGTEGAVEFR